MADKTDFLVEQEIGENITSIVDREIKRLKKKPDLTLHDIAALEKYTKMHTMIMACHREDLKAGLFGGLSEEQLTKISTGKYPRKSKSKPQ